MTATPPDTLTPPPGRAIDPHTLALVADRTSNAVVITDPNGRITWVNPGFTRITGYELSEVAGRTPASVLHGPGTDPATVAEMRAQARAGRGVRREVLKYRKDGTRIWMDVEIQPIRDAAGVLTHFLAIDQDITDRKEAEAAFRATAEQLSLATASGRVVTWEHDPATNGMSFDRSFLDAIGVAPADAPVTLPGWLARFHPDEQDRVEARLAACAAGREREVSFEFRVSTPGRPVRSFLARGSYAPGPDGRPRRGTGTVTEITEQAEAQTRLWELAAELEERNAALEERGRLSALQAEIGLALNRDTPTGDAIRECADAILRHTRAAFVRVWTRPESGAVLELRASVGLYTHTDGPHARVPVGPGTKIGRIAETRTPHLTNAVAGDPLVNQDWAAREGLVSFAGHPLVCGGRVVGVLALFARVPLSPPTLATLKVAADALALGVERKRAEAELQRAKEAAEDANRAKDQFLANMSHEFRTPLAAVVGYAEMLLDPRLGTDDRVRTAQAIGRSGRHLIALIGAVLDLARADAGGLALETAPCRLSKVVDEALAGAEVAAREKQLDLALTPLGRLPRTLTTDPTRFRQILDNLLSNAVKFTSPGKRVEVRLGVTSDGGGHRLRVEVEDQGIGIPADVLPRLFRPFTQADASTTRKYGGTGLGLSICKRLAELLGGGIHARSTPGVGSCFTLDLPLAPADLADLQEADEFAASSCLVRPALHAPTRQLSGRVLVADDSRDNRHILRYYLEKAGLEVETAEDGRRAVEMASAGRFDVVLMDMQMPELDGYAATSTLRQRGYTRAVVAITAHAMPGDEEKCLRAGCNAYLTKPVDSDTLLKMVARQMPSRSWAVKTADLHRRPVPPPPPPPRPPAARASLADLTRAYRQALPEKARAIADALTGDRAALTGLAHKLKGSAGMYGLPEISATAEALESACRDDRPAADLAPLVARLTSQCEAAGAQA